jgi:transcriptional regulator with XRE-family HTH domain
MAKRLDDYIHDNGLIQASDSEAEKPIYRRPGFETPDLGQLDERLAAGLRAARERAGLTHADVAPLLGLHPIVYGRYERGETKMPVTRLIHLSELLNFSPIELIMAAAPYRWGETLTKAERRRRLVQVVEALPDDAVESMLSMIDAMTKLKPTPEADPNLALRPKRVKASQRE